MVNTWFSYCNKYTKTFKNNNPLSNDIKIINISTKILTKQTISLNILIKSQDLEEFST